MAVDELGDRMKMYECIPRTKLMPKVPVMIRLDGKAFHTLTRHCEKPYDLKLQMCMWEAAIHLCKNVQGAQLAYVQSDEISVVLVDYQTIQTDGWFGYDLQKMASVSASMVTGAFNAAFARRFPEAHDVPAFDARVWNLPLHEVTNAFIWRQKDATRNSINSLAQSLFSHGSLQGKSLGQVQEMLFQEKKINWNDLPTHQKRGACIVYKQFDVAGVMRGRWETDMDIPIFTQDRNYIENRIRIGDVIVAQPA